MNVLFFMSLYFNFISALGDSEDDDSLSTKSLQDTESFQKKHRRFLQDLDDEEWHVAHLKDQDHDLRRNDDPCGPKTFEEKAQKYRKALKNDPGLIEYVSAYALPVNESKMEEETCKRLTKKDNVSIFHKISQDDLINKTNLDKEYESEEETTKEREEKSQATPFTPKANVIQDDKVQNKTDAGSRRSEYMFSSVEYYDEVIDFDSSVCPSAVEEITLEIDQIRNYDVECERIIEWRSLQAAH